MLLIIITTTLIITALSCVVIYIQTIPSKRSNLIETDYFKLRSLFISAVNKSGGSVQSFPITARGPAGEELTIDIGWVGSKNPSKVVLHISGTHGVEGYTGSAIQTEILNRGIQRTDPNTAIIFIHGLNPWGMVHRRRVNESNVDLNRNFFTDPQNYQGAPDGYRLINYLLNPSGKPNRIDLFFPSAFFSIFRYGFNSLKQAVAGGQYEYNKGIYYGGNRLEESLDILQKFVKENLSSVSKLTVIEVHSGLGEWAKDVIFSSVKPDSDQGKKYQMIFNEKFTGDDVQQGPGYKTSGDLLGEIPKLLPSTEVLWLMQEFGAYGPVRTLRALRDENRYYHFGGSDADHWSKQMLVEVFCPGDLEWQKTVVDRGIELFNKVYGTQASLPVGHS